MGLGLGHRRRFRNHHHRHNCLPHPALQPVTRHKRRLAEPTLACCCLDLTNGLRYQVVFAAKCFTDTSVNLNYAAALPSSSNYDTVLQ